MTAFVLAVLAAIGTHLVYGAAVNGKRSLLPPTARRATEAQQRSSVDTWLRQAGLDDVDAREFAAVVVVLFLAGAAGSYLVFGGALSALAIGSFAASFPVASYRVRRQTRRQRAQEAWPRMIEEMRIQISSLGRSVPQALFEVGRRGPAELRAAFDAAHREWLLTTDFNRTIAVLKDLLADATADMACETLLVAHELGGTDLDRRLQALAEDRLQDVQGRKDARSRQAGARFARLFVLLVPAGMALAGMSIGEGRAAFRSPEGQMIVLLALGLVIGCWGWAGRVMRLPEPRRVFR